ncbi:MAG: hypothetical protein OXB88_03225, partial [Bacteriovoracales bacterium]|nr:hypothetical protein [Bacteriovoracales bacterium]
MKTTHLIRALIFFLLSLNLYAGQIKTLREMPVELEILTQTYNMMNNPLKKKKAYSIFQKLEKTLGHLEERIEFLLIKNVIYKTLFYYHDDKTHLMNKNSLTVGPKSHFGLFFEKNKNELSPLARWILAASLKENEKKLRAWSGHFTEKDVAQINLFFEQVLIDMIDNLNRRIAFFLEHSIDFRRPQKISSFHIQEKGKNNEKNPIPLEIKNIENDPHSPPAGAKGQKHPSQKEKKNEMESINAIETLFKNYYLGECSRDYPKNLKDCTPFSCKYKGVSEGELLENKIIGMKDGKCITVEEHPNRMRTECSLSKESMMAIAKNMQENVDKIA